MNYYNDNGEPVTEWLKIILSMLVMAILIYLVVFSVAQSREIHRQKQVIKKIETDYARIKSRFGIWVDGETFE